MAEAVRKVVRLYTIPATATELGVSRGTVYTLIKSGELRAVTIRSILRVSSGPRLPLRRG